MYLSVRYANSLNILQSFDFVIVDILNTFAEADMFCRPQCGKNFFAVEMFAGMISGHNVAKTFFVVDCFFQL